MNYSADTLSILARLRPPFARSATLLFPFTREENFNSGITVETVIGEPAVAPGAGKVMAVYNESPNFQTTNADLPRTTVWHVRIDHGGHVSTLLGGFADVFVVPGQTVYRGDLLGTLFTNQLFFSAAVAGKTINPLAINPRWILQNGNVVLGQGGKLRFAPDKIARDFSNGLGAVLNGWRYFYGLLRPTRLLVNIAFNGDSTKAGYGATGFSNQDYWNAYVPEVFFATISNACHYYYPTMYGFHANFVAFGSETALYLRGYDNELSPVILERVAPMFSAAGSGFSWDNMLKNWVGGYVGPTPYENIFRLHNLPAGDYELYLYANEGTFPNASTFYVSVGAGLPTSQANNPTVTAAFVQGQNYVLFTLTLITSGYITFKTVGYLSGLQLLRV